MSKIRVLHVLDQISFNSGVSSVVMNYYKFINKDNVIFDFLVHTPVNRELIEKLEKQGSHIYIMPGLRIRNIIRYRKALKAFFLQHHEYDIIHGHVPNAACFYLSAAKKYGISVRIIHSHSSRGSSNSLKNMRNLFLNKIGVQYANCYFACSKSAGNYLFGSRNVCKDNIFYLHNAIDVNKFQYNNKIRIDIRKQLNITDKFVIGHVGRFSDEKNHVFLLDIFHEILKSNPSSVLLLVGGGELERKIREKAEALKLNENVIFTGIQPNINDYMQAMDVFVLPSLFEGLPVVCIEAQAAGLPCVVSDNVTREMVISSSVYFISNENVDGWVKAIIEMKKYLRNGSQKEIINSGYCIEKEAVELEKKYLYELAKVRYNKQ